MAEDGSPNAPKKSARVGGYRIVEPLGTGGMSSVYRAVHEQSGHEVAIKILPRALAKNPVTVQRFLREAKSAQALQHPNIVAIYDAGIDQGRHYIVLEYISGGDLYTRVKSDGPLPIAEAVAIVRGVCQGLRYAAGRGVIHRDVKPANILVTESGEVKVIDLGLALHAEGEDERVTRDGTTVGTVDYMSPEQARNSRSTSVRSDIYSLGCTLSFLLTGSPPYPGGDVAEKLTKHCTLPPPDPRALRPEIPEKLAALVMRMLAKKPENRYVDYDHLISALDALDEPASEPMLDAIIDDDSEHEGPLLDAIIDEEDDSAPVHLDAIIDEDSGDDLPVLPASPAREVGHTSAIASAPLSLADLAGFDDEPALAAPSTSRIAKSPRPKPEPVLSVLSDEGGGGGDVLLAGRQAAAAARFSNASAETWIKRCAALGLTIVAFVIGIDQFVKLAREPVPSPQAESEEEKVSPFREVVSVEPRVGPTAIEKTVGKKKTADEKVAEPLKSIDWVEPSDPTPVVAAEPVLGPMEAKFVPAWAAEAIPAKIAGPFTVVRRIPEANSSEKSTLRNALDVIGGTIEIADDGPFFEDDLRISGETRLIRARAGFRPIIGVEGGKHDAVRTALGVIPLEGKQLVLDGLDLVVRVDELPKEQTALFYCLGANLALRRCTVTIFNPRATPFAVVRTAGAKPSRVRIEETMIRGPATTAFDLSGSSDVVVTRSVMITGRASLVTCSGNEASVDRKLTLVRDILACKAPVFELSGLSAGLRSNPVLVRSIGTTFGCITGAAPASLIASRDRAGGLADLLRWEGDHDVYVGWTTWLTMGTDQGVRVANPTAARKVWPTIGADAYESPTPWIEPATYDRVVPSQLASQATRGGAILTRVAAPTPFVLEKTFVLFERPRIPALASDLFNPPKPTEPPPRNPADSTPKQLRIPQAATKSKAAAKDATPPPAPSGEFTLDASAPPWNGDLGLFLRDKASSSGKLIKIHVWGTGEHPWSPIRLPDGVSLEIVVDPLRSPGTALSWKATVPATTVEALIDVRGGDLVLSGVNLVRDGAPHLNSLVRVEGGHLVLNRCRLKATGAVESDGGRLIDFRSPLSNPRQEEKGPFAAKVDRPVCRLIETILITGGDALAAEVGRGLIALSHCAIAAGGSAIALTPAVVARSRFEADLSIEHCTIASERNFVWVGPWKGTAPGPDRPWLTNSQDSAFVAGYSGGAKESVLLRSSGESLPRGVLFWQGRNDAYELTHFAARGDGPPAPNPRPDLRRQWIDLWGRNHFRAATGPGKLGAGASVRFVERLKPGSVAENDLVLDPNVHRERRTLDVGAPPSLFGPATFPARKRP